LHLTLICLHLTLIRLQFDTHLFAFDTRQFVDNIVLRYWAFDVMFLLCFYIDENFALLSTSVLIWASADLLLMKSNLSEAL